MNRTFGVELEYNVNSSRLYDAVQRFCLRYGKFISSYSNDDKWCAKVDGPNAELTTPPYDNINLFKEDVTKAMRFVAPKVNEVPGAIHSHAGFHVHVSAKDVRNRTQMATICNRAREIQNLFFLLQPRARKNTGWCEAMRGSQHWDSYNLPGSRSYWFSTRTWGCGRNTIEIRTGITSVKPADIYSWTWLCLHLVEWLVQGSKSVVKVPKTMNQLFKTLKVPQDIQKWAVRRVLKYHGGEKTVV